MRSTGAVNKYVRNKRKGEPFDVYVGRGSAFGNPFHIGKDGTRAEVVRKFEEMLTSNEELMKLVRSELKGKTLGCFCAPELCHAHVLAWYANGLDGGPPWEDPSLDPKPAMQFGDPDFVAVTIANMDLLESYEYIRDSPVPVDPLSPQPHVISLDSSMNHPEYMERWSSPMAVPGAWNHPHGFHLYFDYEDEDDE